MTENNALEYSEGQQFRLWGEALTIRLVQPSLRHLAYREGSQLVISSPHPLSPEERFSMVEQLCDREIRQAVAELWEPCQQLVGVKASEYHLRHMRTRWGSCNTKCGRIWLNLALVHYPPICLRYVLIHELVHLHVPAHNANFYRYMTQFMPGWPKVKKLLEQS